MRGSCWYLVSWCRKKIIHEITVSYNNRYSTVSFTSYVKRTVEAVLQTAEQEKKKKYLEAVQTRRATFSPFVVSVDGVLGREANVLIKRLASLYMGTVLV